MNGKQLRASILQEAIAGRLVPQNSSDEPASKLLKSIREEKARLVKEGKLPKDKNEAVTCINDQIPFEIPDSWEWCRLGSVVQINPKNKSSDDALSAFIPMEKMEATYGSKYTYDTVKWGSIKSGYTHFADGDVAFAKITPCFQNRKSAVFKNLPNGIGAGTTELKVLRPYGETIDRWYLLYFLKSAYFVEEATFKGTANQQRIVKGYLENKLIPLPPLAEQKRIVAKIEELMPLVDEYEKAQEEFDNLNAGLKGKLRTSLLQEAIAGRLVPQDPNDEPASELLHRINPKATPLETDQPLPEGWCATTLSDICTTINGLWKGKKGPFVNVGVIRNANFTKDFKLDYSKIQYLDVEQKSFAKRNLLDGDLIVEKSGGGDKTPVGRAILYEGENGIYSFSNFTMLLRIRDKAEILPKYIYYFLLAKYRSGAMVGMQTHTTGLRNLETDKYLSMPVPLPPLAEQKRIVEKLESMFAVLDNLDACGD